MRESVEAKYSYNFSWLGRPIIQYPQDVVALQQIVWEIKPDLVVETGIAHGGSLILWSSLLELNAMCGGPDDAMVVGIDIELRAHNRQAIEEHPLSSRVTLVDGSSIAPEVVDTVNQIAVNRSTVLVCLDSNHTHDHVLAELEAYSGLVTEGSYCIVFDTIVETMPEGTYPDRPWSVGNNPMTAVETFLEGHPEFSVDHKVDSRLMLTAAPGGFLRRNT
ncbi:MAG: cephalosporin hydroxylase family protein [SAR202 cluster bacterium]|nr:cephalosporin hydroxylase family protein [SAR202 cluster bacterium]